MDEQIRVHEMTDEDIVSLYFARDERAIAETSGKYGRYCEQIAMNILNDRQDTEECVNDTWLRTWNAIPPTRPSRLGAFLAKITRNLALDRYKARHAAKRSEGEYVLSLEELGECVPAREAGGSAVDAETLGRAINACLRGEAPLSRKVFVRRYFYNDSVDDICRRYTLTESRVKSMLFRTRSRLRTYLEREGIHV